MSKSTPHAGGNFIHRERIKRLRTPRLSTREIETIAQDVAARFCKHRKQSKVWRAIVGMHTQEDLEQQIWLKLTISMKDIQARADDKIAFARKIAKNHVISLWREERTRTFPLLSAQSILQENELYASLSLHEQTDVLTAGPRLQRWLSDERADTIRWRVNEALARLTSREESIVWKHLIEDKTFLEITKDTGLSPDYAAEIFGQAKQKLLDLLSDLRGIKHFSLRPANTQTAELRRYAPRKQPKDATQEALYVEGFQARPDEPGPEVPANA